MFDCWANAVVHLLLLKWSMANDCHEWAQLSWVCNWNAFSITQFSNTTYSEHSKMCWKVLVNLWTPWFDKKLVLLRTWQSIFYLRNLYVYVSFTIPKLVQNGFEIISYLFIILKYQWIHSDPSSRCLPLLKCCLHGKFVYQLGPVLTGTIKATTFWNVFYHFCTKWSNYKTSSITNYGKVAKVWTRQKSYNTF